MKKYLVRIVPAQGAAYSYTGLYAHSVDASSHGDSSNEESAIVAEGREGGGA